MSHAPTGHDVKLYVIRNRGANNARRLKPHQIHDLAAAKEKEMEKLRQALGIRDDYVEGDAFKQIKQRAAE